MINDPTKGYTPAQKHHVEMLRKRREKLEREDEAERKRKLTGKKK
jgi:hypothetical protein